MKKKSLKQKGILLDIGLTDEKQPHFIRMATRRRPGVDVVHNLERFPWPLESDSCLIVLAAHVIEHIRPQLTIKFMDELWRVMRDGGQLAISTPYAGSPLWWQDPTHCTAFNELSFCYFDPTFPKLYEVYTPKPWKIEKGSPLWKSEGNIECVMRPVKTKKK